METIYEARLYCSLKRRSHILFNIKNSCIKVSRFKVILRDVCQTSILRYAQNFKINAVVLMRVISKQIAHIFRFSVNMVKWYETLTVLVGLFMVKFSNKYTYLSLSSRIHTNPLAVHDTNHAHSNTHTLYIHSIHKSIREYKSPYYSYICGNMFCIYNIILLHENCLINNSKQIINEQSHQSHLGDTKSTQLRLFRNAVVCANRHNE